MVRSEKNGVEQGREVLCLSEEGLYWFVARSDKEKALPFLKWACGEVFPSIRKTGGYNLPVTPQELTTIMRLPEGMKRDAFRSLLAQAKKNPDSLEAMRLILNVSLMFAAAESGDVLEQAWFEF